MAVAAMRAVHTIGVVVTETAMLDEQVVRSLTDVVGYPCPAFEMLCPAVTDDAVAAPTAHEGFADLLVAVAVVITLVIHGVEIDSFYPQVACLRLHTAVAIRAGVVRSSVIIYLRVPHACTDNLRPACVDFDPVRAVPSSFGNIDDLTAVIGYEGG